MRHFTLGRAALCAAIMVLAGCGETAVHDSAGGSVSISSAAAGTAADSLVALSSTAYSVSASADAAELTVDRTGSPVGEVDVSYTTVDGTATAGSDYQGTSGSITWVDSDQAPKNITIPVASSASGKTFSVILTAVSGDAAFGSPTQATVTVTSAVAGASNATVSPSGSMIPSLTQLVDASGNVWTVSGGVISLDGTVQSVTHKVILLLYYQGVIYQENSDCLWWSWTGGTWVSTAKPPAGGIAACSATATSAGSTTSSSSSSSGGGSTTSSSSSSSGAGSTRASASASVPPAAAAVGYDTLTFGPSVTLGTNWFYSNFYGTGDQPTGAASQNSDGSLFISGLENNRSGATVATAHHVSTGVNWKGEAFGGGAYFEAVLSFTGQGNGPYLNGGPAFWSLDIEHTSQGPYQVSWPGMPKDAAGNPYDDFFEVDFMEYDAGPYKFQNGIGNWYGYPPTKSTSNPYSGGGGTGAVKVASTTNFAQYHKYGCLWVPATPSTQGYLKFYFDDVQTGETFYWNYNNPQNPFPPPPVNNSTAMSGMDQRHMFLILGTGTSQPMTVQSVSVWQATAANNLTE